MNKLILTVGLPRSGKTTWARKQGHPIVNPDSIRLALHGEAYIPSAEAFVWAMAYNMVRALFLAGHNTVIVDATNLTRKRRDEWRHQIPGATIEYTILRVPKAVCISRALQDGCKDLIPVIERMAGTMEAVDEAQDSA